MLIARCEKASIQGVNIRTGEQNIPDSVFTVGKKSRRKERKFTVERKAEESRGNLEVMGKGFLLFFVAVIAQAVLVESQTSKQTRQARAVYYGGIPHKAYA